MVKRILALLLIVTMMLSAMLLTACTPDEGPDTDDPYTEEDGGEGEGPLEGEEGDDDGDAPSDTDPDPEPKPELPDGLGGEIELPMDKFD